MIDVDEIVAIQKEWQGIAVRRGDVAGDTAAQAMRRVPQAVSRIHRNLVALGYPKVAGLVPPSAGVDKNIERLRDAGGTLPMALETFWREVGGIELVDLAHYAHVDFWHAHGLSRGYCDGVYLMGCDDGSCEYFLSEIGEHMAPGGDLELILDLSPDALHKDNVSGGAPYGMEFKPEWTTPLENFEWQGPSRPRSAPQDGPDLLSYLRAALLECAGFPGYHGIPAFEPIRKKLLEGVQPF